MASIITTSGDSKADKKNKNIGQALQDSVDELVLRKKAGGTIHKAEKPRPVAKYASTPTAGVDLTLAANPFGPSPLIAERFDSVAKELGYREGAYPHYEKRLFEKIKRHHSIGKGHTLDMVGRSLDIYVGLGVTGVLNDIFNSGLVSSGEFLVVPGATFPVPAGLAEQNEMPVYRVNLTNDLRIDFDQMERTVKKITSTDADRVDTVGMVFLANPNNPTGYVQSSRAIIDLANACPNTYIAVSEANIDYVPKAKIQEIGGTLLDRQNVAQFPKNLIVFRSFSKAYGLAEARIGYAVGNKEVIDFVRSRVMPFNLPGASIVKAYIALDDQDHVDMCRNMMEVETKKIAAGLRDLGFPFVTESDSNLLVAKIPTYFSSSDDLAKQLLAKDCAVVSLGSEFGELQGRYIRVAASTPEQNARFLKIISQVCNEYEDRFVYGQKIEKIRASKSETKPGLGRKPDVAAQAPAMR